jgi:bacillithiol biosynthesis cysteine-adding enzyme BshC
MTTGVRVIDYGAFPQPPAALFRDYIAGAPGVAPFFVDAARWDLDAIARGAERALSRARSRDVLARTLVAQQKAMGAARAAENAGRLADPRSVAVVTGQQPVLFGGPLFVLYKALGTVRLAADLEQRRGTPVVPVFWIAADDHDFAEIRAVSILEDSGASRTLRYTPREEPAGRPASAIVLDESATALVAELGACLPAGDAKDAILARVAEAYRPGTTLVQAFAHLVSSLVPEIVVLDPSDAALKGLAVRVLEQELREGSPLSRVAALTAQELLGAGYHQQVPVREGLFNLFCLADGARHPLALTDGRVEVRGTATRLPLEEVVNVLRAEPQRFSPGALLRPLVQDDLLPTAAYVGGPAEVAYHAQIGRAYEHFGVPRPVVVARPGVTLLDSPRARVLEAEGLDLPDLQGDAEGLIGRWVKQAYPDIEAGFTRVEGALSGEMSGLAGALAAHDPTLEAAAHATTGRMLHPLESLKEKSMRALKKRDQARADRLRRTHDVLFPGGSFQERGLGLAGLLGRYGESLLTTLRREMDPWRRGHQIIPL